MISLPPSLSLSFSLSLSLPPSLSLSLLLPLSSSGNYVKRQIDRWSKQYHSSRTHDIPAMDRLMTWLPSKAPETDVTTVVHGDYRYL